LPLGIIWLKSPKAGLSGNHINIVRQARTSYSGSSTKRVAVADKGPQVLAV